MLIQIWLVRLALISLALLCFVFGGLTARKGLNVMRSRNIDNVVKGPVASEFGAFSLVMGAFVFLFGFGLIYLLTLF